MTNFEIVMQEALANNIFTEEQLQGFIEEGDIPLKTWQSWRNAGFVVRKGQKARCITKLWQLKPVKKKDVASAEQSAEESASESKFILVTAHLFAADQVARIAD